MPPELGNTNKNKYHYFLCFLLVNENTPHFRDLDTRTPEVFMNAWEQLHLPLRKQCFIKAQSIFSVGSSSGLNLIFDDNYQRI